MSPFSTKQNYTLISYPTYPRPPGCLTTWDRETLEFLSQVGAAAYFQAAEKGRHRQKLDALHRAGLCYKYQLQGERNINVATSHPYHDLKDILKSLAFTQLVKELKKLTPLEIQPGESPIHAVIYMNNQSFPVMTIRSGDSLTLLPFITRNLSRLILISEEYYPEFSKINIPARIALDEILLSGDFYFLTPDGTPEPFGSSK